MARDSTEGNDIRTALEFMRGGGEIHDISEGWRAPRTPKHLFVGKRMDDDTIFAGMSPVTGRPMFAQRARIGGFLLNPYNRLGEYWTSTPFYRRALLDGMFAANLDRPLPENFVQKTALRPVRG